MKHRFIILCALVSFAGILPATAQVLRIPQGIDFGTLVCTSGVVRVTLGIANVGTSSVVLSGAAISPTNADFSLVSPANITPSTPIIIVPGATQAITIAYNPSRIGTISAALVLASNALNAIGGLHTIPLTAQRDSSGFVLSTTNLVLTNVPINSSSRATVTLRNTGTMPITIPTPVFSGAFVLDSIVPSIVPRGEQGVMHIRFVGAPAGVTSATTFSFPDFCNRSTTLQAFAAVQQPPQITAIAPLVGTVGTEVTILGRNLSNTQTVVFGGVVAQSVRIISDEQIVAVVGQGATGQVSVNINGSIAVAPQTFRFIPQPSVLFVSPLAGGTGTAVTIIGAHLDNVTNVIFGSVPAASFTINSPSQITAVVGNGASGAITLTTLVGSTSSTQRFRFIPAPEILFITPQTGGAGTAVTIIGNNLDSTRSVAFGNVLASTWIQVSPTQVQAIVSKDGETGAVRITTPGGTAVSRQVFTFVAPPTISFVSPTIGGAGTIVNIIGTNFTNVTGVSFGGVPAQSFIVSSPTQIIATVGNGASGAITVNTVHGSTTASQQFIFIAVPVITLFSPTQGGAGTVVNIFGAHFDDVTGVTFGGVPARSFSVLSSTQIQAVIGMGASGNIAVVARGGIGFSSVPFVFTPTSVQSVEHETVLEAFPNPASSALNIRYSLSSASAVKIELFSVLGERLYIDEGRRAAGIYTTVVPLEHLPQGMYSCRLQTHYETRVILVRVVK
ncbi:MAG: IPT/TIG domain-containing protein [Bacteroidota bacterium]|nr:IPT/TIG domain-containing protein [Candidatus Kapabacteria bacterium]MDW8220960.1 IPT/TIG domain-containing protein [Bacteroidota bacterium]